MSTIPRQPSKYHILYQVEDYQGKHWNVRKERETSHGWPILIGWPAEHQGDFTLGGSLQVIITSELAEYLEQYRMASDQTDLPICRSTLKRLRRALGMNYHADLAKWWKEHECDLTAISKEFAEAHNVSPAAALKQRRKRNVAVPKRHWSNEEKEQLLALVRSGIRLKDMAAQLGNTVAAVDAMRRKLLRQRGEKTPSES